MDSEIEKYSHVGNDPFLCLKLFSILNALSKNLAFTILYMLKVLNK